MIISLAQLLKLFQETWDSCGKKGVAAAYMKYTHGHTIKTS